MTAEWAKQYIGIPFAELGRDRVTGVDGWGLVRLVYSEQYDTELPSYEYASCTERTQNAQIFNTEKETNWSSCIAMVGSVVLLNVATRTCHAGVVVGDERFIHAEKGVGVVMEHLQSLQWRNRIDGFYNYND